MIQGSFVALVTPFKNNEIDYLAVDKLIEFHISNHTDGILLCGTTGESPALASDEKEFFIRYAIQKIAQRVPVMVGTGSNNLGKTIADTVKAKHLGADYALVITPYYNKPTQSGMYHYFSRICKDTDIPIVIYNVPGRTGVNIDYKTVSRLAAENEKIIGIKDASGNLVQISQLVKHTPASFSVLSGEDALNLPIMACGAKGTVSVSANVVPNKIHHLIKYCLQGNYAEALKIHLDLIEMNNVLFIETNPIPAKEALAMMKIIEPDVRLPLYRLEDKNRETLAQVLKQYQLI